MVSHLTDGETEVQVSARQLRPEPCHVHAAEGRLDLWGWVQGQGARPSSTLGRSGACFPWPPVMLSLGSLRCPGACLVATLDSGQPGPSPLTLPMSPSWVLCTRKAASWKASTRSSASWAATLSTSSRAFPLPLPRPWRTPSRTPAGKVSTVGAGPAWVGGEGARPAHTSSSHCPQGPSRPRTSRSDACRPPSPRTAPTGTRTAST